MEEIKAQELLDEMKATGIKVYATVPDNWLARLIDLIAADREVVHVPVAREEEAVGVCAGAALAGVRAAMVVQNAGVLNCGGSLATFALAYQVPFLMVVSHRGALGDRFFYHANKPRPTEDLLRSLTIPCDPLPSDFRVQRTIPSAYTMAEVMQRPVALLLTGGAR
ncbi:MAG: hypothetical protein HYY85_20695 [Deltaproteobacteria bacterium]|nr:hypothetical protein [Deltaproteobacteria bacterium]